MDINSYRIVPNLIDILIHHMQFSNCEFPSSIPVFFFLQIRLMVMQAFELLVQVLPPEHELASGWAI